MPRFDIKTYPLLRPLSWLYGRIMAERNRRFDLGKLSTYHSGLPTISVGNLAVGGTGKTPMCGHILNVLHSEGRRPALLSRGYGRKTKGYRQVGQKSTAMEVGDEPLELFQFMGGAVPVCVCEDRCEGVRRLRADFPLVQSVVLDDAYQHRYIERDLNILLTDYGRLYPLDRVMPEGLLRESRNGAKRADVIVVTKCSPQLSDSEAAEIKDILSPLPHQKVFFCSIDYAPLQAAWPQDGSVSASGGGKALILTGIANPSPLIAHLSNSFSDIETMKFADHHRFSTSDIEHILQCAKQVDIVITTGKDLQRLPHDLPLDFKQKLCVQRIKVKFLFEQESQFNQIILNTKTKHK